jgi:hypothetical protein
LREQARDRLKTGAAGHVEVEDEHGRPMCVREAFSAWDRLRLGDDLQAFLAIDQQPQPLADDGAVVGDDDGGDGHRKSGGGGPHARWCEDRRRTGGHHVLTRSIGR